MAGPVNIARHLVEMAQRQPHARAVIAPSGRDLHGRARYVQLTYRQLDAASNRRAHALGRKGIVRGMRVVLMVGPGLDFYSLVFALFKIGAVPVLIDPGLGLRNLGPSLAQAEPEGFIGVRKAQLARVLFGWCRSTIRVALTVPRELFEPYPSRFEMAATAADEVAAILFTSGSTGPSKGVVYTHGIFEAQLESLKRIYSIQPGEIDLPTFPLFGLFAPGLGLTTVLPDMNPTRPARVDPRKIVEAIESFGVTSLFGSPALLRRVGEFGVARGLMLPTVRRVICAGAPVSAKVLETFSRLLAPGALIHTPYGATEALPVCSISHAEVLSETRERTDRGEGVCVGWPVTGMRVAVIGVTDEPIERWSEDLRLPSGTVGEIVVKGPVVTPEYVNRPEATSKAKIPDPSGGLWHRMGDLGLIDESGRAWFRGRKAHRVVTPSGTFDTIPCEAVFNTHPAVYRTALVGIGSGERRRPVLCVELADLRADQGAVRAQLLEIGQRFEHTKPIGRILFHPAFPVDIRHNAKIFREKLAAWAERQPE